MAGDATGMDLVKDLARTLIGPLLWTALLLLVASSRAGGEAAITASGAEPTGRSVASSPLPQASAGAVLPPAGQSLTPGLPALIDGMGFLRSSRQP